LTNFVHHPVNATAWATPANTEWILGLVFGAAARFVVVKAQAIVPVSGGLRRKLGR